MEDEVLPETLREFSSMGMPCSTDSWMYSAWKKAWDEGYSGITSCAVVRDEPHITSLAIPSHYWVMEQLHPDEFLPWGISGVYVRDSFRDITRCVIEFYEGEYTGSMATENFLNPFSGFQPEKWGVIIVPGSPGNGKSLFLRFILRCRLLAKLPTIFQLDDKGFALFTEFGVHVFDRRPFYSVNARRLSSIQPDMWCLVDSTAANPAPLHFITSSMLSIIQATSPYIEGTKWADQRKKRKYYMPPFTLEEAIIARSLQPSPPRESELQHWFDLYAPSAGLAYLNAGDPAAYEDDLTHM